MRGAFTILEILVASAILSILLLLASSVITEVSSIWRRSSDKVQAFQGARLAFDAITNHLSQATLNTYLDYDNATDTHRYLRKSELMFISDAAGGGMPGTANTGQAFFFQASVGYSTNANYSGMESLLNPCGYFVSYTTNSAIPSHVALSGNNPYRYRLMQLLLPAESNEIYHGAYGSTNWFSSYVNLAKPVADNVIALIVRPQDPGAAATDPPNNQYAYNSTLNATDNPQPVTANQLPPVVQVTLVAIDETSAKLIESGATLPAVISSALKDKFVDPAKYQADLDDLLSNLSSNRITYRVFTGAVPIRESKWTK